MHKKTSSLDVWRGERSAGVLGYVSSMMTKYNRPSNFTSIIGAWFSFALISVFGEIGHICTVGLSVNSGKKRRK